MKPRTSNTRHPPSYRQYSLFTIHYSLALSAACLIWLGAGPVTAQVLTDLFFLHHSVGAGLVEQGNMRATVDAYNSAHGAHFEFWDHGYNSDGLRDAGGASTGTDYGVPGDNTDPDGLSYLWTSANADAAACRNQIMAAHQVIAFKSCFTASAIADAAALNQYKTYYLGMRNYFDQHGEKVFVVVSPPPRHRLDTDSTQAGYARQFADWLKSTEYLSGHPNIVCFDLFNYLAHTDNMLKYEYESDHGSSDSHPNALANQTVGPLLATFLITSALNARPSPWGGATDLGGGWKRLAWFGDFVDTASGWIWHGEHGWLYGVAPSTSNLWLWSTRLQWLWTSDSLYPYLWPDTAGAWHWYYRGTGNGAGGWFYNFGNSQVEWK